MVRISWLVCVCLLVCNMGGSALAQERPATSPQPSHSSTPAAKRETMEALANAVAPRVLAPGATEIRLGAEYATQENSDLLSGSRQRLNRFELSAQGGFGIARALELDVRVAGASATTLTRLVSTSDPTLFLGQGTSKVGFSDAELSLRWSLMQETAGRPELIVSPFVGWASRATPLQVGTADGMFLATGLDVSLIKTVAPITIYGGVGYRKNFPRQLAGVQVALGDAVQYQGGLVMPVSAQVAFNAGFQGAVVNDTRVGGASLGDNGHFINLVFGVTLQKAADSSWHFDLKPGVTRRSPDVVFGLSWTRRM